MKRIAIQLTLSLLLLGLLSGCGFQLRGQQAQLQGLPQPLYIAGVAPYSPLGRELEQQLRLAGATLTTDPAQAAGVLRISQLHSGDRLLSLDAQNREAESELEESLHFSLRIPQQGDRIPDQGLRVIRTLFRPRNQILARQNEEDTIRADMRRQLVNLLLQRLAAQL